MRILPLLFLAACGAVAETPRPQQPAADFNPMLSLAPLVESVEPAVVNVYSSVTQQVPQQYQRWFGLPSERTIEGQGSGFAISANGYILTNYHVIKGATGIKVKFPSGKDVPAKVVGTDETSDVALLKIESNQPVPYLRLAEEDDDLRVGDWVVAVGNPLGLGHTVTAGIVSGKGRELGDMSETFIQTDASINPGNSGGPLIAVNGLVVGMNTAIIQGANSVGFAIPAEHISDILPQLRETGRVAHGYLGVELAEVPEVAQKAIGKGALLAGVTADSPAAKADLREGDLVVKIGDADIDDARDLVRTVQALAPGEAVNVTVRRDGKDRTVKLVLGEKPRT